MNEAVLVYEPREANRLNNRTIELEVEGTLRLMRSRGMIEEAVGRDRSPVKGKHHEIVIGQLTSPLVHRGDAIAHIAELRETVGSEGR